MYFDDITFIWVFKFRKNWSYFIVMTFFIRYSEQKKMGYLLLIIIYNIICIWLWNLEFSVIFLWRCIYRGKFCCQIHFKLYLYTYILETQIWPYKHIVIYVSCVLQTLPFKFIYSAPKKCEASLKGKSVWKAT